MTYIDIYVLCALDLGTFHWNTTNPLLCVMEIKELVRFFQNKPNIQSQKYKQQAQRLIEATEEIRQKKGWSRRKMANKAGIAPGTFRHWFDESNRSPSLSHAIQLAQFLSRQQLSSQENRVKNGTPDNNEVAWRLQKLRTLLRMIDEELEWFQASEDRRETLRDEIPMEAIGYLGSKLSMLTDEDRFRRWERNADSSLKTLVS